MSDLQTAIQKRDILYGVKKMSAEQLTTLGQQFETAGWLSDAADFFTQAHDNSSLKKLRQRASEEGDVFLLLKVTRSLGETDAPADDLLRCAERAESLGKNRYALKAYERLERSDKVESIRALIANDADIVAEAQSTVFIPSSEEEFDEEFEDSEKA